jgi:hypothetical protein
VIGYVVESAAIDQRTGKHAGTMRVYVATEARAKEIAEAAPGRTWRAIPFEEMPAAARENLERAAAG